MLIYAVEFCYGHLTGGAGADVFAYASATDGRDTFADFVTGVDDYNTDFVTTAANYTFATSTADNTVTLAPDTATFGVFEIEGNYGALDFTDYSAVLNTISIGSLSVTFNHSFMLVLRDTVTNDSYVYQAANNVVDDTLFLIGEDYIELVGVFNNANLATGDII